MIEDQPPPVPNEERPSWELVIEDMRERDRVGRERYGTPLQAGNGRDSLVDAYQEALDLVVYLRTEIAQRRRYERVCAKARVLAAYPALLSTGQEDARLELIDALRDAWPPDRS